MIALLWNIWKRHIHRDRNWVSGAGEKEKGGITLSEYRLYLWRDVKFGEINRGDGCTTLLM